MKIQKGTVIRTVLLLLALINQVLTVCGLSPLPFEDELVSELISLLFTAAAAIVAWWKNNSFTQAALAADEYMNELKGNI